MSEKFRSLDATTQMLEVFFKNTLSDTVTTQEIYNNWGRASEDEKKNKAWLFTCLRHLKKHDLVTTISERRHSRQVIVGLKLTERGNTILGKNRNNPPSSPKTTSTPTSTIQILNYESMMGLVAQFQRENPQYRVKFTIELKEEVSEEK